jgi:hypothetical protein
MSLLDRLPKNNTPGPWQPPGPEFEAVDITQAYAELSCRAFGIWVRLHTCTTQQLRSGRGKLSRSLRVSEPTFNRMVRELLAKGYLAVDSRANKNRSIIRLVRRARTGGSNRFIKV